MKAYTDLEQSRKLAEILPIESADMCYIQDLLDGLKYGEYQPYIASDLIPAYGQGKIRCWSLAALLRVLPSVIKRKGKKMFLTLEKAGAYNLYYKSPDRLDELWETKEDVIDACYDMIIDLHEMKRL